jgi:phage-related protein
MKKSTVWLPCLENVLPSLVNKKAADYLMAIEEGEYLPMPISRPMSNIGKNCHELRIKEWRIIYRIDNDVILILDVFAKKTDKTRKSVIKNCKKRIKQYDEISGAR